MNVEQLHFDGREMLMVHDVFRREFALMPALVRGVAVGDHNRAQIVTDHIERVSALLHHHHLVEGQYTWPLLLERCGPAFASLVELMEEQHEQIATLGREVDAALTIWRTDATVESREALAGAVERLLRPMNDHLRDEEQRVVPLLEQHIRSTQKTCHSRSACRCMRAIPSWSNGPSPTCLPTPAPSSGNSPRRRSRSTPGASMAHPPHRAVPSFKE
jgi:hemerythrin-like domain-containing protein